ncbi:SDR family NAD(P)-dependent oxidoreductase [Massilia dura]|uniref:SDR family NAD(P)-dependent oxidoreductase n=1 Tax=Pseudoduganella dura TaxID=321982 RepID=A0A6I3XC60_9BURK|nr:SDR family oxidoreductase [Pseudoduganella dura]MUI11683.1 SDR family NAD(P)-dependent oxidoreductase [Pseudoduganella dura]GGX78320.1 oxidoreductase [Pseudoduganella dura]
MELKDKVALVTGASSGIGAATAKKLAAAGVKVGLAARRLDRLHGLAAEIRHAGGEALAIEMDVTDLAAVERGVRELAARYGTIDIVFANAGLMPISDIASLKVDEWHRMVDVNIKGLFNTVAAALPILKENKSGHIVTTSSIAGRKTFPGLGVYCATKHAVAAFTDILRMEVAPKHDIRVTCVQPGAVESELFEHITDDGYRSQMESLKKQMTFLKAEDIGDSIVYALQAPGRVDLAEMFIMPTSQPW